MEAAAQPASIFLLSTEDYKSAVKDIDMKGRNILHDAKDTPELTPEQIQLAMTVVPEDYSQHECWTCHEPGHTTFTCPFLSTHQRVHLAYTHYLSQVQHNPALEQWFSAKLKALRGEIDDAGRRPAPAVDPRGSD